MKPVIKVNPTSPSRKYFRSYRHVMRSMGKAISDFKMIQEGDRLMVAVSGGKDSISMLYLLREIQKKSPVSFTLFAYTLDQAQPGFNAEKLEKLYKDWDIEYYIIKKDTYSIVTDKIPANKTFCSLCSRLRRGILYSEAMRLSATKIALGHHSDDAIETLLLNLFYSGRLSAISGQLVSDDKKNIVIRPMIYADEADITLIAKRHDFPIIPCNLCGNQKNLKRQELKRFIQEENQKNPYLRSSMKSALSNVRLSHLWDTTQVLED